MRKHILFCTFLLAQHLALACEPCNPPSLKEAFTSASLIVVAKRVDVGPVPAVCGTQKKIRNATKIKIRQFLKGNAFTNIMEIRACYGMCDYGLFLDDDKEHLIFLRQDGTGIETLSCKPQDFIVEKEQVTINKKKIPVAELEKYVQKLRDFNQ